MKIGFIGAGKVGFSLGKFFAEGQLPLTGYYSRQLGDAQEAALFTGTRAYDTLPRLLEDSDALFLTVPDGEIPAVFQTLREYRLSEKILCHCSGAMTVREAFPGLNNTGAYGYSIHPLFPISDKLTAYRELADAFFCLEGEGPHMALWQSLFCSLGVRVQVIPSQDKVRYHAACAISSNLVCALAQESLELLEGCGFSAEDALRAIAPLMRGNLEHILRDGPAGALTGPVERCDSGTVARHLESFQDDASRELYRAASEKLVRLAALKNPGRDYKALEELLQKGEGTYAKEEHHCKPFGNETKGRKDLDAHLL